MARPDTCENCATPLQGEYCHQCGQSVHNPVRHAGHAIEEFFEAFWHLDGRLWRTLRDLMVPGRTAENYLAGHRARYIPPLRLFVVLSVLTFFIGAAMVQVDEGDGVMIRTDTSAIEQAPTVADVQRQRDRLLAELESAHAAIGGMPGAGEALRNSQGIVREAAAERLAELRRAGSGGGTDGGTPEPAPEPGDGPVAGDEVTVVTGDVASRDVASGSAWQLPGSDEPWHPRDNPVRVEWLPAAGNAWLNRRIGYALDNIDRMMGHVDPWVQLFMGSVPTALFVLVPVFALLLKLAYVRTPRLYLEHMVVALYSHAFLLIALAVMFLCSGLSNAVRPHVQWLGNGISLLGTAIFLWMPVYLLLMQKRIYRQSWPWTVLKYLPVGAIYLLLLVAVTLVTIVVRLSQP